MKCSTINSRDDTIVWYRMCYNGRGYECSESSLNLVTCWVGGGGCSLDLTMLSSELVEIILRVVPSDQEIKLYREYVADGKPVEVLADEDKFMLAVSLLSLFVNCLCVTVFNVSLYLHFLLVCQRIDIIVWLTGWTYGWWQLLPNVLFSSSWKEKTNPGLCRNCLLKWSWQCC